jgi:hypothetical protein
VVSITLLISAAPKYQPKDFVFGKFVNETGCWLPLFGYDMVYADYERHLGPDSVAWLLGICITHIGEDMVLLIEVIGLLQGALALTGYVCSPTPLCMKCYSLMKKMKKGCHSAHD